MGFCALMVLGVGVLCIDPKVQGPVAIDTSCQAFVPFDWSVHDTDETIMQAKEHNAALVQFCPQFQPVDVGGR